MSQTCTVAAPLAPFEKGDVYRLMFEHSPQPMWVFDEETLGFLEVNQAAVATYEYSRDEFLRMDLTQIRVPEEIPTWLRRIHGSGTPRAVWKHVTKGGRVLDVEVVSNSVSLAGRSVRLATIRDLSAHAKIEEQLRHAQKIETVGQLAGGIAHDFNNLLAAIIGHTELLSEYFSPTDPRAAEVTGILHAADVAASLTRRLVAFSCTQVLQPTVLDLDEVIGSTRGILGRLIGEHIELVTDPGPALRCVKVDRAQMEQILLNLAVNARDAMPGGGRLTLRTRHIRASGGNAHQLGLEERDYVMLSVADTGPGIDAAVKTRLFEPFFTTKERRSGTGLGLATVYGIVKQSGGHITVESEAGEGTTFTIYLPATVETASCHSVEPAAVNGGSETVLIVEDDAAVRGLISDVLRRRGYRLLVADGGSQAIELMSAHEGSIDLLITDLVMSDMRGLAVADAVRAAGGDVKVLYISGYTEDVIMPSGFMETSGVFLHKPFTPDALARKVRAVLESA